MIKICSLNFRKLKKKILFRVMPAPGADGPPRPSRSLRSTTVKDYIGCTRSELPGGGRISMTHQEDTLQEILSMTFEERSRVKARRGDHLSKASLENILPP